MALVALVIALTGLWIIYAAGLVIYRLFFRPLAHIPGPTLRIASYLFEWYCDIYLEGQYTFHLKESHRLLGPIVRINPDEVHIIDPDFFDEIYNSPNGRTDNTLRLAEVFGPYPAFIGTRRHELHRIRRTVLNPFFSKKSVNDLVPVIQQLIDMLCKRLDGVRKTGERLDMRYFYSVLTLDVMNIYCFSKDPDYLLRSDFGRKYFDDIGGSLAFSLYNYHMPWIMRTIDALPNSVNKMLAPAMAENIGIRKDLARQIEDIRHGVDKAHEKASHKTVLHDLLGSNLPSEEMTREILRDEAFSLVTAGSETTASVLRTTAYYVSADQAIR